MPLMDEHDTETVYQTQAVGNNVALTTVFTTMMRGCQLIHSQELIKPGTDHASPKIRQSYCLLKDLVASS